MKLVPLVLGTVQFGLKYGINNTHKSEVPFDEVTAILNNAKDERIPFLDTANPYGISEKVIGKFHKNSGYIFPIISKLQAETVIEAEKIFSDGLKKLGISSYEGYYIHRFEQYKQNPEIYEMLLNKKREGLVRKVGFSLYYPNELEFLLKNDIEFDIVQVPFNILDQRFKKYFPKLKKKGIDIHVRSVFLQGIFFSDVAKLDNFFNSIKPNLKKIKKIAIENSVPLHALCLNFVRINPEIDYVVIGVHTLEQFRQNINSKIFAKSIENIYSKLNRCKTNDEKVLVPINWPKK